MRWPWSHRRDHDHAESGERRRLADLDKHTMELLRREWGCVQPLVTIDLRRPQ